MKGLIDALRALGATIPLHGRRGSPPDRDPRRRPPRAVPCRWTRGESSQMLSALLMVAPLAEATVTVTPAGGVRMPFVRMTTRQMAQFGGRRGRGGGVGRKRLSYNPARVPVARGLRRGARRHRGQLLCGVARRRRGGALLLDGVKPEGSSLQGDIRFLGRPLRMRRQRLGRPPADHGLPRGRGRGGPAVARATSPSSRTPSLTLGRAGARSSTPDAGSPASPTRASRRPTACPRWRGN